MEVLVAVLIYAVFGVIVSLIAKSRGRSPLGWFFIGALAPCIGLILVLVLPDLKVQQERERRLADENRRLKEQLRKDRMVADQRHVEVQRRLGAHDVAIGIDTNPSVQELPGAAPRPEHAAAPPSGPDPRTVEWWYVHGGARQGPVPFQQLRTLWDEGRIDGATRVWTAGMPQWTAVDTLPRLAEALDA